MYSEDDLLPISALQHLLYCQRQCVLIHLEAIWDENRWTAEGDLLHARVDLPKVESRARVRQATALPLRNLRLGLIGKADLVEFHRLAADDDPALGAPLPHAPGRWRPIPVEYKRGGPKRGDCDRVQVCAQALCLEEMLHVTIPEACLYYARTRRRETVPLDPALRQTTAAAAHRLHELLAAAVLPPPPDPALCPRCSLRDRCLPEAPRKTSAAAWTRRAIARILAEPPAEKHP